MPQIINSNIASLTAQRHLNSSQSANSTALERLSSGLRINSAKDDAAGLAISTKFESQIKGLNVAIRNAGDGVSLTQTAEGALGSMTENLQRMRELAVQSSNSTNSDSDRVALQAEVSQLMLEVQRTAQETNFNGRNLLDGSFNGTFQIGSNAGNTVDIAISELTIDRLGSSLQSGISAIGSASAIGNGDLTINGVAIPASVAEDDSSSSFNNSASAISKAAAVNSVSAETGVEATVNINTAAGSSMTALAMTGVISLNGVEVEIQTTSDAASSRASVIEALNSISGRTGVVASDSGSDAAGVTLTAADGRNITLGFDNLSNNTGATAAHDSFEASATANHTVAVIAAATGLAVGGQYNSLDTGTAANSFATGDGSDPTAIDTAEATAGNNLGGYTLVAQAGTDSIVLGGGNNTGRGDIANSGLTAGTYNTGTASLVTEKQTVSFAQSKTEVAVGQIALAARFDAAAATNDIGALTNYEFSVGGTSVASGTTAIAVGASSLAEVTAEMNTTLSTAGVTDVIAYEAMTIELTKTAAAAFEQGDTFTFTPEGGGATIVTIGAVSSTSGLAEYVDAFNSTDFSGSLIEVNASLNADGDAVQLDVKNYSGLQLGMIGAAANNGPQLASMILGAAASTPESILATVFARGDLAIANTSNQAVSLTISDPTGVSNLLDTITATQTTLTAAAAVNTLADGDLAINGVSIKAPTGVEDSATATFASNGSTRIQSSDAGLSAISVAATINYVSDETGVSAEVNATSVVGGDGTALATAVTAGVFEAGDQAGLYINGVSIGDITLQNDSSGVLDTDKAKSDAIYAINLKAGETGVTATDNGVSMTLEASDGRNISVAIDDKSGNNESIGSLLGLDAATAGIGEASFGIGLTSGLINTEAQTYETTYGTVSLSSAKEISVEVSTNGKTELSAVGLTAGTYGGGSDGTYLKDIDISTFQGAQDAMTALDNALDSISAQRSELGAMQNRFESTSSNLQIASENLSAANSRIRDADFATETAELSRTQVLQQAGISILAQANQRPQQVLSLLG